MGLRVGNFRLASHDGGDAIMMPMIDFPWWFPAVPLVAHLAMAVPIGWAALKFVDEQSDASSFMGLLKRDRRVLQELEGA